MAERDIVEHLRALARHEHDDLSIGVDAADEITALRAKCERYRKALEEINRYGITPPRTSLQLRDIAAAALQEKE